jgi:hypothetical protein
MQTEGTLLIRAGLAKLLRLKALWVVIFVAILLSGWIQWHSGTAQEGWLQTVQSYQNQLRTIHSGHGCLLVTGQSGAACTRAQVASLQRSDVAAMAQAMQLLRMGAAGFTLLGSAIVALGLLGTGIGFVLGVAVGAIAIETEMRSGGLKSTMLAVRHRRAVVGAIAISCYICALIGVACNVIALVGVSALQIAIRPLGVSAVTFGGSGASSLWILVLAAAVTPAVGIGLALAAGFIGQSSLAAVGGVTALIIVDRLVAATLTHVAPYTLVGAIGNLASAPAQAVLAAASVTVKLWPTEVSQGRVLWGLVELIVIAGFVFYLADASLQRREIR